MRDVAERAEVSIKTVSRVVNDQGEISETTRQRIIAIIEEMGYRPNLLARGLVTQRTQTAGLIIGDITNPFFSEMARGVQDTAQAAGYNIFMANSDSNPEAEQGMLRSMLDRGVDGAIIFPSPDTEMHLGKLATKDQPIIAVNHMVHHDHVGVVTTDLYHGSRMAVDHLAAKGHVHIGMLAGSTLTTASNRGRRLTGFRDGLVAHNLVQNPDYIRTSQGTYEGGLSATQALLTDHPEITAIFTFNDLLAVGALTACQKMGRRVPQECAIIGFDDILLASLITPALTTVRIDKTILGHQAMRQLLTMIHNPDQPAPPPIMLDVELIIRESA